MNLSHAQFFLTTDLLDQTKCFARVWSDTQEFQCFSKKEYSEWLSELPHWRSWFEETRLFWLEYFKQEEVDPLGLFRHLFLNAGSTSRDSSVWLFEVGFVHLSNLTGFYWVPVDSLISFFLLKVGTKLGVSGERLLWFGRVLFCALFLYFFGLSGLKRSFLRPLILIFIRWFFLRSQKRVPLLFPLTFFLGSDILVSGVARFYGTLHYAAALLGGKFAFSKNPEKGWKLHWNMAVYSWLACIAFEWSEGRVSIFTPILSLLTLPLLSFGIFPIVAFTFLSRTFFGTFSPEIFNLGCVLFDTFIGKVAETLSLFIGPFRTLNPLETLLGVVAGIVLWILIRGAVQLRVCLKIP